MLIKLSPQGCLIILCNNNLRNSPDFKSNTNLAPPHPLNFGTGKQLRQFAVSFQNFSCARANLSLRNRWFLVL